MAISYHSPAGSVSGLVQKVRNKNVLTLVHRGKKGPPLRRPWVQKDLIGRQDLVVIVITVVIGVRVGIIVVVCVTVVIVVIAVSVVVIVIIVAVAVIIVVVITVIVIIISIVVDVGVVSINDQFAVEADVDERGVVALDLDQALETNISKSGVVLENQHVACKYGPAFVVAIVTRFANQGKVVPVDGQIRIVGTRR